MSLILPQAPAPEGVTWVRPKLALEAFQLTEDCDWEAVAAWCAGIPYPREDEHRPARVRVFAENVASAYAGDWIVRETRRFVVCKPSEFAERYEITEEPADV